MDQLQAAVTALEEQLIGRGILRRFISAQTSRESLTHDACSSASFLSAAAGFLRCLQPTTTCQPIPLMHCHFVNESHVNCSKVLSEGQFLFYCRIMLTDEK